MKEKSRFKINMPHAFVLIFFIVLVACLLTYIVPAGVYDMMDVNGRSVVNPESFHYVDQTPVGLWGAIKAIPQGLVKQAGIIFMIMVIGGGVEIINKTRVLEASIGLLAYKCRNKLLVVVPLIMLCFVIMGAIGVSNAIVAFVPLGLMIASSLGADALAGVALVNMAMNLGFTGGAFLAATTGTAQSIVGLPTFSAWAFRVVETAVFWIVGAMFLVRYIKRVQKDPSTSIVHDLTECMPRGGEPDIPQLTPRLMTVLAVFVVGMGFVVYGAIKAWNSNDAIPAIFFATGVLCGLVYGFTPNEIAKYFVEGCKKLTAGALIVGISAAIGIVLTNGNVIHTIVHSMSSWMVGMPKFLAAEVLYVENIIINTFITSGSGQAAAVMPIFSPVCDIIGITQQAGIIAFQCGDGFTNQILPMSSVTMAGIAMGNIPFDRWCKFVWKWILINLAMGAVAVGIAAIINLGPF